MPTPHAHSRDPLAALGLTTLGGPALRSHLTDLFIDAPFHDLLDALRVVYAVAKGRSEKPGDLDATLAKGVNSALCHSDMLWADREPSTIPARAAALPHCANGAV